MSLVDLFDEKAKDRAELAATEPKSVDDMVGEADQDFVLEKAKALVEVVPRVDYDDFANHVFFGSAIDRFNVAGERIVNDYPHAGARDEVLAFEQSCTPYQKRVSQRWPKRSGIARIGDSLTTGVVIDDIGSEIINGIQQSAILSPGTASFAIEGWVTAPVGTTCPVFEKYTVAGDGFFAGVADSCWVVGLKSGSVDVGAIALRKADGSPQFFSMNVERTSDSLVTITLMTASQAGVVERVLLSPGAFVLGAADCVFLTASMGAIDLTNGRTFIASSGSAQAVASSVGQWDGVSQFTGSIDELCFWKKSRSLADVSASYDCKVYAQDGLAGYWRFNEAPATDERGSQITTVYDSSGNGLHGTIVGDATYFRQSGSYVFEEPDPIRWIREPSLAAFIVDQQTSGSAYDRQNANQIVNLVPQEFLRQEELEQSSVLRDFLGVYAQNLDDLKVRVDQLVHAFEVGLDDDYDDAPDALLSSAAREMGWDLVGGFLDATAKQSLLGKDVGADANSELDAKLRDVKSQVWRRVLSQLMHVYKSKGTRESVDALLRAHGVGSKLVRLKEYARPSITRIKTVRSTGQKSANAFMFCSGAITQHSMSLASSRRTMRDDSIEMQVAFPLSTDEESTPYGVTGSLFSVTNASGYGHGLYYRKQSRASHTGSLVHVVGGVTSGSWLSTLVVTGSFFDAKWRHVAAGFDAGTQKSWIRVSRCDGGELVERVDVTGTLSAASTGSWTATNEEAVQVRLGASSGPATVIYGCEAWADQWRVYGHNLSSQELDDHCLNYQSCGAQDPVNNSASLQFDLRVDRMDAVLSTNTVLANDLVTRLAVTGSSLGTAWTPSATSPFERFEREHSFITPPDGWEDSGVDVIDGSRANDGASVISSRAVGLELSVVDALNEDVSTLMSSLDAIDSAIGIPAGRYRAEYEGFRAMRDRYFSKLAADLNFRAFADMLKLFDTSFVEMVKRLIPARAKFLGARLVVESHMLERPKVQATKLPSNGADSSAKSRCIEGVIDARPLARGTHWSSK